MNKLETLQRTVATPLESTPELVPGCSVTQEDYGAFLKQFDNNVDLILTDPPYVISKKTGFKQTGKKSVQRFAVSMDFGKWDKVEIDMSTLAQNAYSALRKGGTIIIWYDIWKVSKLCEALTGAQFSMLRLIIWNKTNPVPLNSKNIYLSNSKEMAVVAVKGGKPTFNAEYDRGMYYPDHSGHSDIIYNEPIPRHNGKRIHPTQKPLSLFEDLIKKHSNEGDLVVDPFLGSGTTAVAAMTHKRLFAGCDIDHTYTKQARQRIYEQFE